MTYLMYAQNKGNVLLLSVGPVEGNLHRLLGEALGALAEEMHLHLVVEDWEGKNQGPICTFFKSLSKRPIWKSLMLATVCQQISTKSGFKRP